MVTLIQISTKLKLGLKKNNTKKNIYIYFKQHGQSHSMVTPAKLHD